MDAKKLKVECMSEDCIHLDESKRYCSKDELLISYCHDCFSYKPKKKDYDEGYQE